MNGIYYVVILSCILFMRHEHTCTFLAFTSNPLSLPATNKAFVWLFILLCFHPVINVSINQELMCTI